MVIASELMAADSINYDTYYQYVVRGTTDKDQHIVTAAIRALRNANGAQSIKLLFQFYESKNGALAHAAEDVIRYRYVTASNSSGLEDEASLIKQLAVKSNLAL